jgi:phenylalanyl-tRNA synthetase beta subunit
VPAGSLSRTFRLRFNDAERSLTDAELDPLVARLLERVAARHGARLRS